MGGQVSQGRKGVDWNRDNRGRLLGKAPTGGAGESHRLIWLAARKTGNTKATPMPKTQHSLRWRESIGKNPLTDNELSDPARHPEPAAWAIGLGKEGEGFVLSTSGIVRQG
jgi:hypothetical protein